MHFIILSFLIIIHEMGHVLIAYYHHVFVKEIYIYPLGGISRFDMDLNIHSYKEFMILIGGGLFQQVAYFILTVLFPSKIELIQYYHYHILLFNLLPIFPLDGGRICCLLLENIFPFRMSRDITLGISIIMILIILFSRIDITINKFVMVMFLIVLVFKEFQKREILYQEFLLERYLKKYRFRKSKIISSDKLFYRDRHHLLKVNGVYILEEDYLIKKYDKCLKSY